MLDVKWLRTNIEPIEANLKRRQFVLDVGQFQSLESDRRMLQTQVEALRAERNELSKTVGQKKAKGESVEALFQQGEAINSNLQSIESQLVSVQKNLDDFLMTIPNLVHESVPDGHDENDNVEVRRWGTPKEFAFAPADHVTLGEQLGDMDFENAAKISGARFVVLYDDLARLQRALIRFMLDWHTQKNGYQEVSVPYLVNAESMYGTGQFPKFKEEQFTVQGEPSLSLIPTTEVPLTNLVRGCVLEESNLPKHLVGHSTNFRREAGTYGKDMRGMLRQHQFEKVELVHIVRPEDSYAMLETMTQHAESILQALQLPYRVMALSTGDIGFAAAKTYDLEVWLPGQNRYREISSCSNCTDFQARRMQARFRRKDTGKIELVHTLNGSGLAVGRTLIAVMENNQEEDGSIRIPEVLRPYMGGLESVRR